MWSVGLTGNVMTDGMAIKYLVEPKSRRSRGGCCRDPNRERYKQVAWTVKRAYRVDVEAMTSVNVCHF